MTDVSKWTVLSTLEKFKNKEISSVELTRAFLGNIAKDKHNAYITVCEDSAINAAKQADSKISQGNIGKLEGIPLAIKDIFCTKNIRTTAGSRMLENFIPPYESDVTAKLLQEGAVFLGKTNMDEFAMGSTTMTSYFGKCINNWREKENPEKDLVPGGSSGGSAVAVSANLCLAATGSDTGGSIRQPAAFCNLVGVKPSYGMCSRYGMIAYASSFDQAGFLTKNVADAAYLMEIIAGSTGRDSMMYQAENYNFSSSINNGIKGLNVGIPKQFHSDKINADILKVWNNVIDFCRKSGANVIEIDLPNVEKSINVYYTITPAEASSNLARFDGVRYGHRAEDVVNISDLYLKSRTEGFGEEVRRRIMIGNYVLASENYHEQYDKAMRVRRVIKNEFDAAFEKIDCMIFPTTPNVAFGINDKQENPILTYLNDIYTVPVNLAGLPGISIPCGLSSEGLPIGMQVVTQRLNDAMMYQIAKEVEKIYNNV